MNEAPHRRRQFSAVEIAGLVLFLGCVGGLIYRITRPPDSEAVAVQVKPLIAAQWQAHPVMMLATLDGVGLEHKAGGEYTGVVEYSLHNYRTHVPITVHAERGGQVEWKLDAADDGFPLHLVTIAANQVFVEHPVTEADAQAYAEWMLKEKHFDDNVGSTLLSRVDRVVIVRIGLQAHILADMEADRELDAKADVFFRTMAEGLSEQVFRGPVDVHLCDANLATKKVIAWR